MSSVVRTDVVRGRPGLRSCLLVVTHWCDASAMNSDPSLSSTSRHGRPSMTSVAATT